MPDWGRVMSQVAMLANKKQSKLNPLRPAWARHTSRISTVLTCRYGLRDLKQRLQQLEQCWTEAGTGDLRLSGMDAIA